MRRTAGTVLMVTMLTSGGAMASSGSATAAAHSTAEADGSWLLSYAGKTTNRAFWDPSFKPLLKEGLPDVHTSFTGKDSLVSTAIPYLGGPPDAVKVESGRFVSLAAAVDGVGVYKGFLWVDTGKPGPPMIFAAFKATDGRGRLGTLQLFTRDDTYVQQLPPQFIASLSAWLAMHSVQRLSAADITGRTANVSRTFLSSARRLGAMKGSR